MAMSKHQLAGSLTKKTLTLEEKIKLLDPNKERKQSCQQLAEMFNISKTAAANIKNEASIRKEYEKSKGELKRKRKGQSNDIEEILHEWSKKCCAANIYPDGPMLKEKSMEIKTCLDKVEFKDFTVSNGWLPEMCKISYGARERKVNGEAGGVAEYTVNAWMERLVELTRGYELADIWIWTKQAVF